VAACGGAGLRECGSVRVRVRVLGVDGGAGGARFIYDMGLLGWAVPYGPYRAVTGRNSPGRAVPPIGLSSRAWSGPSYIVLGLFWAGPKSPGCVPAHLARPKCTAIKSTRVAEFLHHG
jgi:hypothetical protein